MLPIEHDRGGFLKDVAGAASARLLCSRSYVTPNFKSKKALKEAVAKGETVTVFSVGLGSPPENGKEFVEGPHYPKPHTWYAEVVIQDGRVVKVK